MSPSTALRAPTDEAARWRSFDLDLVAIVVAAVIAVALTHWVVTTPSHVPLTVENGTDYELTISVSKPGQSTEVPVVVIGPHRTRVRDTTIDQGAEWVFHLTGQGRDGGDVAVSRSDLEAANWTFTVPTDVVDRLEQAGATPPPPSG